MQILRTCLRLLARTLAVTLFVVLAPVGCSSSQASQHTDEFTQPVLPAAEIIKQDRGAFAGAFAQVKEGMHTDELEALLGKPDDIRTQADPDGISISGVDQIWCYGTDQHLGFPTLATVDIDYVGRVRSFHGTTGAADLVAELGEEKLRRLLRLRARSKIT
jgi:hypothetical protein